MRVDIDPTINQCAVALVEDARAEIEKQYLARHVSHYMIREEVLFRLVPTWIKTYGKPTADQAVRWLLAMPLDMILTKSAKRQSARWLKQERLTVLKDYRPKRNNWINRWAIRMWGIPLYGLVLALGASWAASPVEARGRERHDHLQACAAAPERERHAMGCWRFSPSEIAISRPWDDPPARPSWDNKRPWERQIDE